MDRCENDLTRALYKLNDAIAAKFCIYESDSEEFEPVIKKTKQQNFSDSNSDVNSDSNSEITSDQVNYYI